MLKTKIDFKKYSFGYAFVELNKIYIEMNNNN